MDRRTFLGTLAGGLLAAPLAAQAQPAGKIGRVGFLGFGLAPSQEEVAKSPFWLAMKQIGWVEGQNMVVERRYGESSDQVDAAAAELVRLKVDIIVTYTGTLAIAASKATQTIPIVMAASGDAVRQGLVASLARPGGNITALTTISPDLSRKRLEILRLAVPKLSRVGCSGAVIAVLRASGSGRKRGGQLRHSGCNSYPWKYSIVACSSRSVRTPSRPRLLWQ